METGCPLRGAGSDGRFLTADGADWRRYFHGSMFRFLSAFIWGFGGIFNRRWRRLTQILIARDQGKATFSRRQPRLSRGSFHRFFCQCGAWQLRMATLPKNRHKSQPIRGGVGRGFFGQWSLARFPQNIDLYPFKRHVGNLRRRISQQS